MDNTSVQNKIDILLSTYNGEMYIRELLNSIFSQTYTNWNLLIRDDQSTDQTVSIIKEYQDRFPNQIQILTSDRNIGVIKSFETLMNYSQSEYLMFCDQDDIWLPNKIELSIRAMEEHKKGGINHAIVVYTDLIVVDKELHTINNSFWQYSRIKPALLKRFNELCVHPAATGCTMLINKEAKEASLPFTPDVRMHDAWITLAALKANGCIIPVYTPTILYRQHEKNTIGAKEENKSYVKRKITHLADVIKANKAQWKMIHSLGFSSPFLYICYKIKYFVEYNCK